MEGTTFIDESDMALYLEVSDRLTVLTLNSSLQYFYMTAIHDTKPLVLSFPLSVRLYICVQGGLAVHQLLSWGQSVRFWLMGAWQVAVGNTFFFLVLLYSLR